MHPVGESQSFLERVFDKWLLIASGTGNFEPSLLGGTGSGEFQFRPREQRAFKLYDANVSKT